MEQPVAVVGGRLFYFFVFGPLETFFRFPAGLCQLWLGGRNLFITLLGQNLLDHTHILYRAYNLSANPNLSF